MLKVPLALAAVSIGLGFDATPLNHTCQQSEDLDAIDATCLNTVLLLQKSMQFPQEVYFHAMEVGLSRAKAEVATDPLQACRSALVILYTHPAVPFQYTPFGTTKPQVEVLEAGVGEVLAQGLLQALRHEQDRSSDTPSGTECWTGIGSLGVQYDPERSLALSQNAPHLWDAVVAWNRRVIHDHDLLRQAVVMFAGIYGVPPSDQMLLDMDRAGGFDVMFEVLQNNASDLVVAQAAWAGLSDNVENMRTGAELAANHGGPGVGLTTLVGLLKKYRGRHAYQPGMRYGLRYESVHVINGILMHDNASHAWRDLAGEGGFMDEAILAMVEEPTDQLTQENGCEAIALMGSNSSENLEHMRKQDAIRVASAVIDRFKQMPPTSYYHVHSCSAALLPFAEGDTAAQDEMLRLGLLQALTITMPLWVWVPARNRPWGSFFPWSNVEALFAILQQRNATLATPAH